MEDRWEEDKRRNKEINEMLQFQYYMVDNLGSRVVFGYEKYLGGVIIVRGINSIGLLVRERLQIYLCVYLKLVDFFQVK